MIIPIEMKDESENVQIEEKYKNLSHT